MNNEPKLSKGFGLRVYRRNDEQVIFLWNLEGLTEDQRDMNNAKVSYLAGANTWMPLRVKAFTSGKEFGVEKDKGVFQINHAANDLDPDHDYLIKATLGAGDNLIEQKYGLKPVGELQDYEKDSKKQRVHLMGYVKSKRRWGMIHCVELADGTLALPVVMVKEK